MSIGGSPPPQGSIKVNLHSYLKHNSSMTEKTADFNKKATSDASTDKKTEKIGATTAN